MTGKIRCSKHGGKTPIGPESPHFKHGATSKYLPRGIRADYESAFNDPRLLSLKQDIATVDARLSQIFRAIDSKETPEFIELTQASGESILEALTIYKQAALKSRNSKDEGIKMQAAVEMGQALTRIEEMAQALLDQANNSQESAALWKESYSLIEQRRKLVDSESRLQLELRQTITKERALILFGAIVEQFRLTVGKMVEPETARTIMLEVGHKVQALISAPAKIDDSDSEKNLNSN